MSSYSNFLESTWIQNYKFTDQTWLVDSLNWDKLTNVSILDFSFLSFLHNGSFISQHLLVDYSSKISYLDVVLLNTNFFNSSVFILYNSFLNDFFSFFSFLYLPLLSFFTSSQQDVFSIILLLSPELLLAVSDYFSLYYTFYTVNLQVSSCFDSYTNNLTYLFSGGVLTLWMFLLFVWLIVYFFSLNIILKWSLFNYSQYVRFYLYFFSFSKDTRLQFEVVLQTALFFLFYWSMAIMAFDDDKEELIEYLDTIFFYFFTFIIFYFFYKHSIHYFSFLESSSTGSRSTMFVLTQFKGDFLALFSMILRFYSLLLRLNVYDILDDCLDFYYVFIGDFDDDEYLNELFFSIHGTLFFTMDNQDDRSFLLEDENDFSNDFFYTYFLVWGKIFYFLFYTVELVARFGLAFYVIYLVLFEIYGVNCSYKEDMYFTYKRNFVTPHN